MKFVTPSKFTDPDAAARKLLEIANGIEADHAGGVEVGWPRNRRRSSSSLSRSLRQITTTDVCPSERTFVAALVGIKGDRLRLLATEFAGRELAWRQLGLGSVVDFAL